MAENTPKRLEAYNPLHKKNLGESVADHLLRQRVEELDKVESFVGAGVYAIYYSGPCPAYEIIAKRNKGGRFTLPIYVGKAVPQGSRKGGFGLDAEPGLALYKRLREHADSIKAVKQTLAIGDFHCRYLVVDDIWIPLGESLLIEQFAPVWNVVVEGFGIHAPGSGRAGQRRSSWDALHRGRKFAEKLPPELKSPKEIVSLITNHLAQS